MKPGFTVDALGRRKWDKEFYRNQAEQEMQAATAEAAAAVKPMQALQERSTLLSLEDVERMRRADGLLHCDVCNVKLRDTHAYFDHINGKNHHRALGMTMQVQKASSDAVRTKLLEIRQRLYPDQD